MVCQSFSARTLRPWSRTEKIRTEYRRPRPVRLGPTRAPGVDPISAAVQIRSAQPHKFVHEVCRQLGRGRNTCRFSRLVAGILPRQVFRDRAGRQTGRKFLVWNAETERAHPRVPSRLRAWKQRGAQRKFSHLKPWQVLAIIYSTSVNCRGGLAPLPEIAARTRPPSNRSHAASYPTKQFAQRNTQQPRDAPPLARACAEPSGQYFAEPELADSDFLGDLTLGEARLSNRVLKRSHVTSLHCGASPLKIWCAWRRRF